MDLKFIFMLCLFFPLCENTSFSSISLLIKKLRSLRDLSASDALRTNQGEYAFPTSQKSVENVFNHFSGSWNVSSNYTKLRQYPFGSKNADINKQDGMALLRNDSAFFKELYEHLFTNASNAISHDLLVSTTTTGKKIQPKMMETDVVDQSRLKENIATRSTRYTNKMETRSTEASPRMRWGRAKTESVQSVLNRLFEEEFSGPDRKRQRQSDGARERNSKRRQKMKKPGRFREGEVFYFRDADEEETTTSGGEETTTSGGEETTKSGEEETTTSGGEETTTSGAGGEETTTSGNGGEETTTSGAGGEETTTTNGTETTTAIGGDNTAGPVRPNVNVHYHVIYFGGLPGNPETFSGLPPIK